VLASGRGVLLAEESAVTEAELVVCVDLDAGRRGEHAEARCRMASAIERAWLPAAGTTTRLEVELDPATGRVGGARRTRYLELVIAEAPADVDPAAAAAVLAAAAGRDLAQALPLGDPEVARFLARCRALAAWLPELGLPTFDEDALRALLPALCHGRRSLAELRRAPLLEVLRGQLTHAQVQALERDAPDRLTVPSGSRIRLEYPAGGSPVLAARIQELFGLTDTPRVARGRVPVLLHLLAPSGRPQQVTHDLRSFWTTTYPEVRKELRARYPKHAWPEDPLVAAPERRPRRR
jgi:ATP-dependent helicase HrpB